MKYYLLIVFVTLMAFLLIGSYIHENSHESVFYGYGYESVTNYNVFGFLGADTVAVPDDLKHDVAGVNQMNIWAEIIGYNTILLGIAMILSAFIIGFAIMMKGD